MGQDRNPAEERRRAREAFRRIRATDIADAQALAAAQAPTHSYTAADTEATRRRAIAEGIRERFKLFKPMDGGFTRDFSAGDLLKILLQPENDSPLSYLWSAGLNPAEISCRVDPYSEGETPPAFLEGLPRETNLKFLMERVRADSEARRDVTIRGRKKAWAQDTSIKVSLTHAQRETVMAYAAALENGTGLRR